MNTGKDKGSKCAKRNGRPGKQAETVASAQAVSTQAADILPGSPIVGTGAPVHRRAALCERSAPIFLT